MEPRLPEGPVKSQDSETSRIQEAVLDARDGFRHIAELALRPDDPIARIEALSVIHGVSSRLAGHLTAALKAGPERQRSRQPRPSRAAATPWGDTSQEEVRVRADVHADGESTP
jgi:hypothetical protein